MYENSYANGAKQEIYSKFKNALPSVQNAKLAIAAAINAIGYSKGLAGFKDYANGATNWDGIDLITSSLSNGHRSYIWSADSKSLLLQYKKDFNGGVNVKDFIYKSTGYQISATAIIGKSLFQIVEGGRGERKDSAKKIE